MVRNSNAITKMSGKTDPTCRSTRENFFAPTHSSLVKGERVGNFVDTVCNQRDTPLGSKEAR